MSTHILFVFFSVWEAGGPLIAFNEAIYCAEIALKAVLEKNEKFSDQDKHLKIPRLFKKIKSERCLPSDLTLKLEDLIGDTSSGGLGYIDILFPPDFLLETTSGEHVQLRHPKCRQPGYNRGHTAERLFLISPI